MNNAYSKFNDINAVIEKANKSLPVIEQDYSKYLKEETIPESLLVDIKDYLANLRTALDYLWHKIPNISGDYFPVGNSEADFLNKIKGIDPKHALILNKHQNYSPNSWIRCFNLFRNKNVHLTLVPQKRNETKEFSIKGKDGSSVKMVGCVFGGEGTVNFNIDGVTIPIDKSTQFPANTPSVDIERIIWIDFLFDGSSISSDFPADISALPFLKESLKNTQSIISELEQLI